MRFLETLVALSLSAFCACSAPTAAIDAGLDAGGDGDNQACDDRAAGLAAALEKGRVAANSPGSAAAVLTPDCGLWGGASGTSTQTDPLTSRHLAWVGSVTKTFVSETVLRLAEANALGIDDALSKYVPTFPGAQGITVRQLLSHRSGIFNYTDDANFQADFSADTSRVWTPDELIAYATTHSPYFAPGAGWHYSNTNYVLLAMIVMQVTGGTLAAALRAQAFDPADLGETFFDKEPTITGPRTHGFSSGIDVTYLVDMSFAIGAGGVLSTPGDLVKWAKKLYEGSLLQPASMNSLFSFGATGWPDGMQYGLGVMQFPASTTGELAIGHGGDQPGYHTWVLYFPGRQTAVAAYVNSDDADRFAVMQALLEVLQGSRPAFN